MDTDTAWKQWGKQDPYFGVLTAPEYRSHSLGSFRDTFFGSGEAYMTERLALCERLYGGVKFGRAFDFGCGVGRLTIPLAGRFREVIGMDISSGMLEEAQRNLDAAGIRNVALVHAEFQPISSLGSFDFVHTYIVVQHIDVPRGMKIVSELLDAVAAGGVASIHLSIDRGDSVPRAAHYWARRHLPGVQRLTNLVARRRADEPLLEMNEYSLPAVFKLLMNRGFGEITIGTEFHGRVLTANLMSRRS